MQLKLPATNRIVAFAGPYISLLSGAVASWLVVHVQVLGSLHLGQNEVSTDIAYVATAALGAGIPHLGFQKWLDGHQKFTADVFNLIDGLPDSNKIKGEVIAALPAFNGDILAALKGVVEPASVEKTSIPAQQGTALAPAIDLSGDGSGDVEHPNALISVTEPELDPPPAGPLGDDSVHAPIAAGGEGQPSPAVAESDAHAAATGEQPAAVAEGGGQQ
jgi:hypothetical protein